MDPIVKVEGLSKQYCLGKSQARYATLREALMAKVRSPLDQLRSGARPPEPTLWALKDVSFDVLPGETVGIIGSNGAGKSTLLKILSRITEPTHGRAWIRGRVGSLLEVGTGFHPELTGRENIYLNGAVLGMTRVEIGRKFDEIVAFAETEKFLDTAVKHYSSGMYLRLAFAVAAHLEPEILIVDEVLAVGDARFQAKCLGKMSAVAKEGRTVLFVSHNMPAVEGLCKRVIWLREGQIADEGDSGQVVENYLAEGITEGMRERVWPDPATAPGNAQVRLHRVCVRPVDRSRSEAITIQTPLALEFEYWNLEPDACLNLGLHLYDYKGTTVFKTAPVHEPVWHGHPFPAGLFRSVCYIPGELLNDGLHRVQLLIVKDQSVVIYSHSDVLTFEVNDAIERRGSWFGKWEGAVRPNLVWETELLTDGALRDRSF